MILPSEAEDLARPFNRPELWKKEIRPMTPEERAEKILEHTGIDMFWDYEQVLKFTIAQIREAEKEAFSAASAQSYEDALSLFRIYESDEVEEKLIMASKECQSPFGWDKKLKEGHEKGRASMREEAAKLVDKFCKCEYKSGVHEVWLGNLVRAIPIGEGG